MEYRAIPSYENTYEIGEDGTVFSLPRTVVRSNGVVTRYRKRKPVKSHIGAAGYPTIRLHRHGRGTTHDLHVLVAAAFLGPRPTGMQVRHLDGDRTNPHWRNLAYGSQSQNQLDSVAHGTHVQARKSNCPRGHEYATVPDGSRRYCPTCASRSGREPIETANRG